MGNTSNAEKASLCKAPPPPRTRREAADMETIVYNCVYWHVKLIFGRKVRDSSRAINTRVRWIWQCVFPSTAEDAGRVWPCFYPPREEETGCIWPCFYPAPSAMCEALAKIDGNDSSVCLINSIAFPNELMASNTVASSSTESWAHRSWVTHIDSKIEQGPSRFESSSSTALNMKAAPVSALLNHMAVEIASMFSLSLVSASIVQSKTSTIDCTAQLTPYKTVKREQTTCLSAKLFVLLIATNPMRLFSGVDPISSNALSRCQASSFSSWLPFTQVAEVTMASVSPIIRNFIEHLCVSSPQPAMS